MLRKIAHFGDIQINCDERNAERTFEYASALNRAAQYVIEERCDTVVIAGDVFERFNTTDDERKLYTGFIHQMLDALPDLHIIVIDGNHDIRKRNFAYYDGVQTTDKTTVLDELATAINSNRYHYSIKPAVYMQNDIAFACWSEYAKHHDDIPVSPYTSQTYDELHKNASVVIDVYHGTIAGAKDLGTDFELPADDVRLLGDCAMLGHIHKHQVIGRCVYSSSLVQRSFNEGVRVDANGIVYNYENDHGFVLWTYDDETKTLQSKFIPIFQPVLMLTLVMTPELTKDKAMQILQGYAKRSLSIKLVLDNANAEALAFMYAYCNNSSQFKIKKVESVQHKVQLSDSDKVVEQVELNIETFRNIAYKLYAQQICYADEAFASEVMNKAMQLVEQECGYHLNAEQRSYICMHKVIIDNFKTIGHAEIDFAEHGLAALRGQNGQGKTTCFEAIAFGLTGQHNRTFKRNAKNKQFIRLFNDKQPGQDVVRIDIELSIDGRKHLIRTLLTKHMREGWNNQNWKSMTSNIAKHVQVYEGNDLLCSDADAEAWLLQRFGTYDDFAVLHMLDQSTLDAIKFMSTEDMANFILQRLGYSVISKLQHFYGGCRNVELQNAPMTTEKTFDQLTVERVDAENAIRTAELELNELRDERADYMTNIESYEWMIQHNQKLKRVLPEALIQQLQACSKPGVDLDDAVRQANEMINVARQQIKTYDEQQKTKDNAEQAAESAIMSMTASSIKDCNDTIARVNADIAAYEQSIATATEANHANELQRQALQQEKTTLHIDLQAKHTKQNQLLLDIERLQGGKCPLCGSIVSNDDVAKHIAELNKQISELACECDAIDVKLKTIELSMQALPPMQDITASQEQLTAAKNTVAKMTAELARLNDVDYRMQLLKRHKPDVYAALQAARNAQQPIDISACSYRLQYAESKLNEYSNAKTARNQLQGYEQALKQNAELDKANDELRIKITAAKEAYAKADNACNQLLSNIGGYRVSLQNLIDLQAKRHAYDVSQEALKHYKWLIFEALPKYLYNSVCNIVNSFIDSQHLPDAIKPHLSEELFGQVVLRDRMEDGQQVDRPILEASGMEITMAGLVICLALHEAKLSFNFPFILLDELSGKLNTGTEHDKTDYLATLLQVLRNASDTCQLLMVDHRIADDAFDSIVRIVKDNVTNVSYTV